LMTPINQFELSVRARNGLNRHNINTLYDLTRTYESQLLSDQRFGESSLDEVRQALYSKGLDFKGYSLEQDRKLLAPVSELGLSVRSSRIMERLDIRTIGDLRDKTEVDIMASRNSGMTTLNEIKRKLGDLGLSLREDKKRE
jgi:DNA-directed RNA polymerase subunit alpha